MADKYLSIITNFGCHYSCPECIVRNNKLKMTPTDENSSWNKLSQGERIKPYAMVQVTGYDPAASCSQSTRSAN